MLAGQAFSSPGTTTKYIAMNLSQCLCVTESLYSLTELNKRPSLAISGLIVTLIYHHMTLPKVAEPPVMGAISSFECVCRQMDISSNCCKLDNMFRFIKRDIWNLSQIWTTLCLKKKLPTFRLSVTSSNLNRFSKFLHCWKAYEICYKNRMTLPISPKACCYTTLRN